MAPLEDKRPPILKDTWTRPRSLDESSEPDPGTPRDADRKTPTIKKRVSFKLSEFRRQSLTGSLPDLGTTADKSSEPSEVDLNIRRDPLPVGSDVFRAVMDEIDEDLSSSESLPDTLSRSWAAGCSDKTKSQPTTKAKFQSKAAEVIYSKLHPLQRRQDKNCVSSPRAPCSPRSRQAPSSPVLQSPRSARGSSASALKLSPLISGEVGEVRVSSEKVGIRRQHSTTDSPRLLHRKQEHKKLQKSFSLDR